jgi:hypothetical protein
MNCADFETRLHDGFGSSRLTGSVDLAEHARDCGACRAVWEKYRLLADGVGAWREQVPEVDLTDAVISAFHAEANAPLGRDAGAPVVMPSASTDNRRRRWETASPRAWLRSPRTVSTGLGSFAAILVVAMLLRGLGDAPPERDANSQVAAIPAGASIEPARIVQREPKEPAAEDPVPLPEPPQSAYYDLAQMAAGALGEMSTLVMPGALPPRPPSEPRSDAAADAGWIDGLEHQLRPIGRSLDKAFDFLWQAGESADSSQT